MITAIAGRSCTGKTSIGMKLAENMGCPFFSAGNYFREFLAPITSDYKVIDSLIDDQTSSLIRNLNSIVLEGRTTGIILSSLMESEEDIDGFSVLLEASYESQIERLLKRDVSLNKQAAAQLLKEKDDFDRERLYKIYGTDIFDRNHYDLYIDTTFKTMENVLSEIECYGGKKHE